MSFFIIIIVTPSLFLNQCITEKVEYQQDPENTQQTVVKRHAWIESQFHIRALRRPIEVFIYNKFSQSCVKVLRFNQSVLKRTSLICGFY